MKLVSFLKKGNNKKINQNLRKFQIRSIYRRTNYGGAIGERHTMLDGISSVTLESFAEKK
jgi:hypothetical protein